MLEFKSDYFSWTEVTGSQIAARRQLDNEPHPELYPAIQDTANHMDALRKLLGHPILVSSWYRSDAVNFAVGGAAGSSHKLGYSVDFTCPELGDPLEVFSIIAESGIKFDQLIVEFNRWVHISFDPRMRQQKLSYNGRIYRSIS